MTSFVVVGSGWRAEMFWRLADGLPEVDFLGAVAHLIALAIEEAADTDRTVTTGAEAWA
jgi:hypothetical protein